MRKCSLFIFAILFGEQLYAQNIDLYLTLLEKGRLDEVKLNLPELLNRYPDEAGVYFLQAMVNDNGDASLIQFRDFINKFPNSPFASRAGMKIGEYLFSRGLYSQASVQFKAVLFKYPQGDHHQRALDLMVNSYFATGEEDSAKAALRTIKQLYPSLKYLQYGIEGLDNSRRKAKLVKLDPSAISNRIKSAKAKRKDVVPKRIPKPWVIQVGAFGKYDNANRLKKHSRGMGMPQKFIQ